MHPLIRVGEISITFLKTRHETHSVLDLFEMTIPPTNHMVLSHLHRDYDETVIGLNGVTTWTINGIDLPPEVLRKIYFENAEKLLARPLAALRHPQG